MKGNPRNLNWRVAERGCWEVVSHNSQPTGYVQIERGKIRWRAHRFMWRWYRGQIPEGICVLHKCDNPTCVNPDHLFLGTNADNTRDMCGKSRQARGERGGKTKLTERQARTILQERIKGRSGNVRILSQRYNISQAHVREIGKRAWKHLVPIEREEKP